MRTRRRLRRRDDLPPHLRILTPDDPGPFVPVLLAHPGGEPEPGAAGVASALPLGGVVMIPRRISGANVRFGKPADWEQTHAERRGCCDLWVRRNDDDGTVESAWEPTAEELATLNAGGSVVLCILGGQPPVMIYATPLEQESSDA